MEENKIELSIKSNDNTSSNKSPGRHKLQSVQIHYQNPDPIFPAIIQKSAFLKNEEEKKEEFSFDLEQQVRSSSSSESFIEIRDDMEESRVEEGT